MVSSLFLQLLYNYCIDINIYLEDSTGNTKSNWDKIFCKIKTQKMPARALEKAGRRSFRLHNDSSVLRCYPRTTSQSPQSAPAGAACCRGAGWHPCWSCTPSAAQRTPPQPPGRGTGRCAAWRLRTGSGCGPSSRWAYSRRFSPWPPGCWP